MTFLLGNQEAPQIDGRARGAKLIKPAALPRGETVKHVTKVEAPSEAEAL